MKNKKRLIVLLLLAAFLLTMAACNKDKEKDTQPSETAAPTIAETPASTATPEPFEPDENILMPEGTLIE